MVQDMNFKAGDSDCVLLLLCKLKPFVWSMQKAIDERIVGDGRADGNKKNDAGFMNVFFKFVPSLEEFKSNGMECEENYSACKLFE